MNTASSKGILLSLQAGDFLARHVRVLGLWLTITHPAFLGCLTAVLGVCLCKFPHFLLSEVLLKDAAMLRYCCRLADTKNVIFQSSR